MSASFRADRRPRKKKAALCTAVVSTIMGAHFFLSYPRAPLTSSMGTFMPVTNLAANIVTAP